MHTCINYSSPDFVIQQLATKILINSNFFFSEL